MLLSLVVLVSRRMSRAAAASIEWKAMHTAADDGARTLEAHLLSLCRQRRALRSLVPSLCRPCRPLAQQPALTFKQKQQQQWRAAQNIGNPVKRKSKFFTSSRSYTPHSRLSQDSVAAGPAVPETTSTLLLEELVATLAQQSTSSTGGFASYVVGKL